ncbi:MAG: BamA/TamA family outer membrane protein [Bacteroidetes bacterium]|nr:BamA/TamA family outer membrane protein [Bacteroidota bacterium]
MKKSVSTSISNASPSFEVREFYIQHCENFFSLNYYKKIFTRHIVFLVFVALLIHTGSAQSVKLSVKFSNELAYSIVKTQMQAMPSAYADSGLAYNSLQRLLYTFYENGYLEANYQFQKGSNDSLTALFDSGNSYKLFLLKSEQNRHVAGHGYEAGKTYPFTLSGYKKHFARVLSQLQDNGYPFAEVSFTNVIVRNETIEAQLSITYNQLVLIDTLHIDGDARISARWLARYLQLDFNSRYNESEVAKISQRIKNSGFLSEAKAPRIQFMNGRCFITTFINSRKSSSVDGIVGVLPPATADGKTIVTGEVKLHLVSALKRGETFDLHWRQPQPITQRLTAQVIYPYIAYSNFGVEGKLELYKKDTTFIDVMRNAGVTYALAGNSSIKFFAELRTISLLQTSQYKNATVLPSVADLEKQIFGAGYAADYTDYKYCPTRGAQLQVALSAGKRSIIKNANIMESLYDTLDLKTNEYRIEFAADYYLKIAKRFVINAGIRGAYMEAQNLFENELYRFGGLKTLRGFDEEVLIADKFAILKVEPRFLLDRTSYFFAFYNQGYYQRNTSQLTKDFPKGFGAGIAFETKAGIFSFNYALGSERKNPIQFRSGKIHFGIVSAF